MEEVAMTVVSNETGESERWECRVYYRGGTNRLFFFSTEKEAEDWANVFNEKIKCRNNCKRDI